MKIAYFLITLLLASCVGVTAAQPISHCTSEEIDFFSCQIKNSKKVASFCGNRSHENNEIAWLQYRFGVVGHPEMIYPTAKEESVKKFTRSFQHSREAAFFEYEIWFNVGSYIYLLSVEESGDESVKRDIGVYYKSQSHAVVNLSCTADENRVVDHVEELGPNLSEHQD